MTDPPPASRGGPHATSTAARLASFAALLARFCKTERISGAHQVRFPVEERHACPRQTEEAAWQWLAEAPGN
jgi:hypothetical protein